MPRPSEEQAIGNPDSLAGEAFTMQQHEGTGRIIIKIFGSFQTGE